MKRNLLGLAMVAALAAGALLAQNAQGGLGKGRLGAGANLRQRVMKNLNLTDAQKTQARGIFQAAKSTGAPIRTQLQAKRQAMAAAVKSDNIHQIKQLASEAGALQGELLANRAGAMAQFYAILTPDQQAKLDRMQGKIQQLLQELRGGGQAGI